jgi:nucleoid DNA-binding protein
MNKLELANAIAHETGLTKTAAFKALTAITQQLDAEGQAGRAVVLEYFGTFLPRQKMGQRTGKTLGGGDVTYDNWKLIPAPEQLDEMGFITLTAQRAQMKTPMVAVVLQCYKTMVIGALRKGASVYDQDHGSFKVGRRKARVFRREDGSVSSKRPPMKVVVYRSIRNGQHQKFIGLPGLI